MTKIDRTYHDNGAIATEGMEIDGIPHGIVRHWHPNGVPAMEIPMDHGIIDGVVKQWNEKGELIAVSELNHGTGVLRTLAPEQGIDGEITYVNGKLTGRQISYCAGELMGVSYWLDDKKVSRKRYLEACKENPALPRYEDDRKLGKTWQEKIKKPVLSKPETAQAVSDELPLQLLRGSHVREALAWLEETRQPSRSVGEAIEQEESIRLIKKLYNLGAVSVHAVEIDGGPADDQNTGRLVIEMPREKLARAKLLRFCGTLAREEGFDPESDLNQDYVLLMLG
jgi:antitoxin component YwqK of YwqJK toxin-antitoxin module